MHRIDGPGATVDNKFTDGDPVGGVQATVVTDDWMNDVQEELINLLTAAGITPVKGTQNQVLKAVRTLTPGLIGGMRNAKMSVPTTLATATFTADEVIVKSALGSAAWILPAFNKTINLATTGIGGMDTGTVPVTGFVALYAMYNQTTGASGIVAVNAMSVSPPEIYGGANAPSGYTASALIGTWPIVASKFIVGCQIDRTVYLSYVSILSTSTQQASFTSLSIASAVPPNAKAISGLLTVTSTTSSQSAIDIAGSASGIGAQNLNMTITSTSNWGNQAIFKGVPLVSQQLVFYIATTSSGTPAFGMFINAYDF